MAKFKADQLHEMIRSIVRQEIDEAVIKRMNEVVVKTINEVLSERYLKQLAENIARPRGVGPTLHIADGDDNEEEGVPPIGPQNFGGRDIYGKHPMKRDDEIDEQAEEPELRAENIDRNDMLSLFFEGTRPLEEVEESDGVPLEKIMPQARGEKKQITEVWRTLAGVKPEAPPARSTDKEALEAREEMRLKMLRESLERPAR